MKKINLFRWNIPFDRGAIVDHAVTLRLLPVPNYVHVKLTPTLPCRPVHQLLPNARNTGDLRLFWALEVTYWSIPGPPTLTYILYFPLFITTYRRLAAETYSIIIRGTLYFTMLWRKSDLHKSPQQLIFYSQFWSFVKCCYENPQIKYNQTYRCTETTAATIGKFFEGTTR